jgi:VWFA-related protein
MLSMRTTAVLAALVLMVSALPLAAQSGGEAAFGEAIDVRVVNVEAVVTGKDGERVRGLTKEDFRLLVDGREVPVGFFNEIVDSELVATEGGEAEIDMAEPETFGRRVLVFVDDSFGIAPHRNAVLDHIGQSLDKLSPQDQVAIVEFDGRNLDLLTGWTSDRTRISDALTVARTRRAKGLIVHAQLRDINKDLATATDIRGFSPQPVPTTVGPSMGRFGQEGFDGTAFENSGGGVTLDIPTLLNQVIAASAAAMRAVPVPEGRKVMLLLSGGWPMLDYSSPLGLTDQRPLSQDWLDSFGSVGAAMFQPLVDTANRLGYTLYPVDMPGLGAGNGADVQDTNFASNRMISSPWDQASATALNFLAEETGGKAAVNSARLEALDRMAEDTRSYYWLGFTPAWRADDRHHRIEVVVRRPGLRVRSRNSFTDMSRRTEMAMSTEGLLLFGPKDSRQETPDRQLIKLEMGVPQRAGLSTVKVPVTLSIPAESLTLVPVSGGFAAEASLSVGALDRWGSRSDLPMQTLRLNFDRQPKPGDIVRYRTVVKMSRGRQQIVFTLRDSLTGEMLWAKMDYKP